VIPVLTDERSTEQLERIVLERRIIPPGSVVVFVNVSPDLSRSDANFLNVQRLG
jgi:hypothetical protein